MVGDGGGAGSSTEDAPLFDLNQLANTFFTPIAQGLADKIAGQKQTSSTNTAAYPAPGLVTASKPAGIPMSVIIAAGGVALVLGIFVLVKVAK